MADNEQNPNNSGSTPPAGPAVAVVPATTEQKLTEAKTFQDHKDIRQRGGVRLRIDQKTREAHEATRAATAAAEAARTLIEELRKGNGHKPPEPQPQVQQTQPQAIPAPAQPAPQPVSAKFDKPRPQIGNFTNVDDYWSAMADWQIEKRQAEGTKPVLAGTPPETPKPAAPADTPEVAALKAELNQTFDGFRVRATEFAQKNPDWQERLIKAGERGLELSIHNQRILMELPNGPAVAYYLAHPDNESKAREIMKMSPTKSGIELIRLSEKMTVNPAAYVSSAPAPIPSLRGSGMTRSELPLDSKELSFQDYKRIRREGKRAH